LRWIQNRTKKMVTGLPSTLSGGALTKPADLYGTCPMGITRTTPALSRSSLRTATRRLSRSGVREKCLAIRLWSGLIFLKAEYHSSTIGPTRQAKSERRCDVRGRGHPRPPSEVTVWPRSQPASGRRTYVNADYFCASSKAARWSPIRRAPVPMRSEPSRLRARTNRGEWEFCRALECPGFCRLARSSSCLVLARARRSSGCICAP